MTTRRMSLIVNIRWFLLFVGIFLIWSVTFLYTVPVIAQDEEYYQDMEENYEEPQYEEYIENEEHTEQDYQDPDPEFMEEVEPGEYDQSDDVTDIDQNYN